MSDWKVKDSYKSGDDWWVKIGPETSHDGAGIIAVFSSIVLTVTVMNGFELTGLGWGLFVWLIMLGFSTVFLWPALILSILILFFA